MISLPSPRQLLWRVAYWATRQYRLSFARPYATWLMKHTAPVGVPHTHFVSHVPDAMEHAAAMQDSYAKYARVPETTGDGVLGGYDPGPPKMNPLPDPARLETVHGGPLTHVGVPTLEDLRTIPPSELN